MSAISACTPMHNVSANMEVAVRVDLLNAICAEQKDKKTNVGFKQLFQHLLKQDRVLARVRCIHVTRNTQYAAVCNKVLNKQ